MDKLKMQSPDITQQNIDKLLELFPNCKTEKQDANGGLGTGVDFDLLKQELSKSIVEGPKERYQLNWPGKKEALITANAPIAKTLRPCREESIDFDTTENLFIEGDNLEALKLLQETYLGKVKMIYIDPPYNTGKDFIYSDNFAESTEDYLQGSGQKDEEGNRLIANTDSNGRFHSDWMSMMYSRLKLSKNLLKDDGVMFISIDDSEMRNIFKISEEVFGEDNFVANLYWQSKSGGGHDEKAIVKENEYILCFAKRKNITRFGRRKIDNPAYKLADDFSKDRGHYSLNKLDRMMRGEHYSEALNYPIKCPDGSEIWPGNSIEKVSDWNWRWSKSKLDWGIENNFIEIKRGSAGLWAVYSKQYEYMDHTGKKVDRDYPFRSLITSKDYNTTKGASEIKESLSGNIFDYAKPQGLMQHLVRVSGAESDDIVLDLFAGSGTVACALLAFALEGVSTPKCISIQLDEQCKEGSEAFKAGYLRISDVSKERIRRVGSKINEKLEKSACVDRGFRVLKIDSSNMNDVHYRPDTVSKGDLFNQVEHIKTDRSSEDLLFQVMLDWGVDLSLPMRKETIEGKEVYFVNDDDLVACFEKSIDEALIKALAAKQPLRVVFRDDGFVSDSVKINVEQIFKQLAPATDIKAI